MTNTIDLAIQTLPLADKMKYLREPLNLKKIETSKAIYDKANKDLLKTELLYKTHSLNDTICNSLLLMDSLSEEIQESCFIVLKSRLGIMGNRLLLILLVPGDFDHSVTGEKSQKVTRENDQKSHLTPLIIQFPEDCQKQFLPFL